MIDKILKENALSIKRQIIEEFKVVRRRETLETICFKIQKNNK